LGGIMDADSLPTILRQARRATRLSQLALSLRVGVSQRHVSFVESGRARPSRQLLLAWLQELDAPLGVRNAALVHAGYAPVYGAAQLTDPELAQASHAMQQLLRSHDPFPAFVLDARWNVHNVNRGGLWLATTLLPWLAQRPATAPLNMLDLLAHPDGLTRCMANLEEVGPTLLAHLRDDAAAEPALTPQVDAFAVRLRERVGSRRLPPGPPRRAAPVLTTRFVSPHGELAFFSMFTTFGTPHDITLASLRVEHLFAADDVTASVMRVQVAPASQGLLPAGSGD
jgi:transcriptional regulator with XRE-family HTH domain